tara:strand:- start:218 stop:448 length:231 start_codon:yes stop_codon:yes gene_type:complete
MITNFYYHIKAIMIEYVKPFLMVATTVSTPMYMWFKDYATPLVVFCSSVLGACYMYYNFKLKKLEYEKALKENKKK